MRHPARPKKTRMARSNLTVSSPLSRPIRSPSLERGIVVILSAMRLQGSRSPLIFIGLDTQPDQRCLSWISRKRTHCHRLGRVEPVVLKDHHGPRLADVAAAGCRSPDLAARHPSSWLRASMKAWSSAARVLLATAAD